jgi:hypothetical protein
VKASFCRLLIVHGKIAIRHNANVVLAIVFLWMVSAILPVLNFGNTATTPNPSFYRLHQCQAAPMPISL